MKVLVSCCDNNTGLFLWEDGEWVHLMDGHAMSIFPYPDGYINMMEGCFVKYDSNLNIMARVKFNLPGHHGSTWDPKTGRIVVASSETNTLHWVDPITGAFVDEMKVNSKGSHTNDIEVLSDVIYVSSFGKGITAITRLNHQRVDIYQGQQKPHTVKYHKGDVWWCESEKSKVRKNGHVVAEYPGFVRGLAWDRQDELLVGISHHKYRHEGDAGFYYMGEFHAVPPMPKRKVTNVYSLLAI